ncbi:MAG: ATP synthase F1 subunit epsilon [Lachnospiraceae bacterium]|nr:ATP synthase F1 subunit epsilon [Lachnospiraceae bacterium]
MAELMKLQVICPDRMFYEGEVSMVELNTTEGEIGIYPKHIPMTCIIAPGVLTITEAEGLKNAALHSGFIQILPEKVTILAEAAEWPHEIDVDRAEAARGRAEERIRTRDSKTDIARAETALQRAVARINIIK